MASDWRECLGAYAELAEGPPEGAVLPALALREKARAGELPEEAIVLLTVCMVDAPHHEALRHLAKGLAAFGRQAQIAERPLIQRLQGLTVRDDESFWTFDSCLHALGFLGSKEALALVTELSKVSPSPVQLTKAGYEGERSSEERKAIFDATLKSVRASLEAEKPASWRKKATDKKATSRAVEKKTVEWG